MQADCAVSSTMSCHARRGAGIGPDGPGMIGKARGIGHQARALAADLRAAGTELPKAAQGVFASYLARGVSAETIFAALTAAENAPAAAAQTGAEAETAAVVPAPEKEAPDMAVAGARMVSVESHQSVTGFAFDNGVFTAFSASVTTTLSYVEAAAGYGDALDAMAAGEAKAEAGAEPDAADTAGPVEAGAAIAPPVDAFDLVAKETALQLLQDSAV